MVFPVLLAENLAKCHRPGRGMYGHFLRISNTVRLNQKRRSKNSQSSSAWLKRQSKDPYARQARDTGSPSRAIFKLEQIDRLVAAKHVSKTSRAKVEQSSGSDAHRLLGGKRRSLFELGQKIVDIGASPGGWSLYAAKKIGKSGALVSVDLLQLDSGTLSMLESKKSFHFIQGDFNSPSTKNLVVDSLRESSLNQMPSAGKDASATDLILMGFADCIISDMAANFTGDKMTDSLRTLSLCEDALMLAVGNSCFDHQATGKDNMSTDDVLLLPWQEFGVLDIGGTFLCKFFSCGQENERELMMAARHHFERVDVLKPPASRKESSEKYLLASGYRGNRYLRALVKQVKPLPQLLTHVRMHEKLVKR